MNLFSPYSGSDRLMDKEKGQVVVGGDAWSGDFRVAAGSRRTAGTAPTCRRPPRAPPSKVPP